MSLLSMVAEMVCARKTGATVDDLYPDLSKHGFTRRQVMCALKNAANAGRIEGGAKTHKKGRFGSGPGVWYPIGANPQPKPKAKKRGPLMPVPSVFALADVMEWQGPWPPGPEGRKVIHLEPWEW